MAWQDTWAEIDNDPEYQNLKKTDSRTAQDLARFFARKVIAKEDRNAVGPFLRYHLSPAKGETFTEEDRLELAKGEAAQEGLSSNLTGMILDKATGKETPKVTASEVGKAIRSLPGDIYNAAGDIYSGAASLSDPVGLANLKGQLADPASIVLGGVAGKVASAAASKVAGKLALKAGTTSPAAAAAARAAQKAHVTLNTPGLGTAQYSKAFIKADAAAPVLAASKASQAAARGQAAMVRRAAPVMNATAGGVAPLAAMAAVQGRPLTPEETVLGVILGAPSGVVGGHQPAPTSGLKHPTIELRNAGKINPDQMAAFLDKKYPGFRDGAYQDPATNEILPNQPHDPIIDQPQFNNVGDYFFPAARAAQAATASTNLRIAKNEAAYGHFRSEEAPVASSGVDRSSAYDPVLDKPVLPTDHFEPAAAAAQTEMQNRNQIEAMWQEHAPSEDLKHGIDYEAALTDPTKPGKTYGLQDALEAHDEAGGLTTNTADRMGRTLDKLNEGRAPSGPDREAMTDAIKRSQLPENKEPLGRYYRALADDVEAATGLEGAKDKFRIQNVKQVEAATAKVDDVTSRYGRGLADDVAAKDEVNTHLDEQEVYRHLDEQDALATKDKEVQEALNHLDEQDALRAKYEDGGISERNIGITPANVAAAARKIASDIHAGVNYAAPRVAQGASHLHDVMVQYIEQHHGTPLAAQFIKVQHAFNDAVFSLADRTQIRPAIKALAQTIHEAIVYAGRNSLAGQTLANAFISFAGVPYQIARHWRHEIPRIIAETSHDFINEGLGVLDDFESGSIGMGELDRLGLEAGEPRVNAGTTPRGTAIRLAKDKMDQAVRDGGAISDDVYAKHYLNHMPRVFHMKEGIKGGFGDALRSLTGYFERGNDYKLSNAEYNRMNTNGWQETNRHLKKVELTNATGQKITVDAKDAGHYTEALDHRGYAGPHSRRLTNIDRTMDRLKIAIGAAKGSNDPAVRAAAVKAAANHNTLQAEMLTLLQDPKTKIKVHRDWSLSELKDMDIDRNVLKGMVKYDQWWRRNATSGLLFKYILDEGSKPGNDWVVKAASGEVHKEGYTLLTGSTRGGNVKKYGVLDGHFVANEIMPILWYQNLKRVVHTFNKFNGTLIAKTINTVLSPAYYAHNIEYNMGRLKLEGGDWLDLPLALKSIKDNDVFFKDAVLKGYIREGIGTREFARRVSQNFQTFGPGDFLSAFFADMGRLPNEAGKYATYSDDVFRLSLMKSLMRKEGLTFEQAGERAREGFYNANNHTSYGAEAMGAVSMFPKPAWDAVASMARAAKNPFGVMIVAGSLGAKHALTAAQAGVSGDTLDEIVGKFYKGFGNHIPIWPDKFGRTQLWNRSPSNPLNQLKLSEQEGFGLVPQSLEMNAPWINAWDVWRGQPPKYADRFNAELPMDMGGRPGPTRTAAMLTRPFVPKMARDIPKIGAAIMGEPNNRGNYETVFQALAGAVGEPIIPIDVPVITPKIVGKLNAQEDEVQRHAKDSPSGPAAANDFRRNNKAKRINLLNDYRNNKATGRPKK